MSYLEVSNLSKSYGEGADRTDVLKDINLKVDEGEFIAIVGFSGSGKTTLISALAGLLEGDQGGVIFKGQEIDGPGPERGLVFQSYSLMPWLSVTGNVALAVDSVHGKKSKAERNAIVEKYIDMVGLTPAKDRKPAELSGGMRQRVSVARALAMQPEVLLLDEPLSALDALTRSKLQDEFADICEKEKKTIILITNDVDEAILLADRIIPLTPGPNATLGKSFDVNIPRPRDRAEMNHDETFIQLRGDVTNYLMEIGLEGGADVENDIILPNVVPFTAKKDELPEAYVKASAVLNEERFLEFSQLKKVYPTPKGPLTVVDGFELKMKKG
ncbi:MAG: ABC transporter ATP-binding protein, partial [Pseudomonadota bacterium]